MVVCCEFMKSCVKFLRSQNLKGAVVPSGDKSISHRSFMLGALAVGKSVIRNALEGEDVLNTIRALRMCGADIEKIGANYVINGMTTRGLREPKNVLDMGNSGTSTRLMMGVLSVYDFNVFFTGDDSLVRRPMKRVMEPLSKMGVRFESRSEGRLPLMMRGNNSLMPIEYSLVTPSAQVKSAILLAGLSVVGTSKVVEPEITRDHTEIMLRNMGADICQEGNVVVLNGGRELSPLEINVPSDPSSAAFVVAAGLVCEGSEVVVRDVCINPTRTGFYEVIKRMGADVFYDNVREECGEKVADIVVKYSLNKMRAIDLEAEIAPLMIDEYPILFVLCALIKGVSRISGLKELTVKESNRLEVMAEGLRKCGVEVEVDCKNHSISIDGGVEIRQNSVVATQLDHRIAMSFLILGLAAKEGVEIDDGSMIKTSFPNFFEIMANLGVRIGS